MKKKVGGVGGLCFVFPRHLSIPLRQCVASAAVDDNVILIVFVVCFAVVVCL